MEFEQAIELYLIPWGLSLLSALLVFLLGKLVAGWLSRLLEKMLEKRLDATVAGFFGNISHAVLLVVVIIAALDQLGVQTTSIIAILGAAGLAVGFALKDSLGNFAAGVMLILFRPFKAGDFVEAGGTMGTVREIRIHATIFRTPDNKEITVPNSSILNSNITNFSAMPTRRVDMVFGVSYDADLSKVRRVLSEILAEDDRVLPEPEPLIAVSELGNSSVNLLVRPWVNGSDYWPFFWETTEKVKSRFDEEGITIPFPQMDVHLDKAS